MRISNEDAFGGARRGRRASVCNVCATGRRPPRAFVARARADVNAFIKLHVLVWLPRTQGLFRGAISNSGDINGARAERVCRVVG